MNTKIQTIAAALLASFATAIILQNIPPGSATDSVVPNQARVVERVEAPGDKPPARPSEAVQSQLDELQADFAELRSSQRDIRAFVDDRENDAGTAPASSAQSSPADPEGEEPSPLTPEEQELHLEQRVYAQVNALEATLMAESVDRDWSDSATGQLYEMLQSDAGRGLALEHAECRSTLCKLEVSTNGSIPGDEAIDQFLGLAPWPGQGFMQLHDGPSPRATLYVAREGYGLPAVAE